MNQRVILRPFARACKVACAVVSATFMCSVVAIATSSEPVLAATCSGSLQAKIDAAPVGGTVRADACIYREQLRITKPITLIGQEGTEIRGSDIWGASMWSSFTSGGVTYYRSTSAVGPFYQENQADCASGTKDCAYPEQVFMDGAELEQVYSLPASGEFLYEPTSGGKGKIVVRDNPANSALEVTTRRYWITGSANADGVTIKGFTMKHAANEKRSGAIMPREGTTLNSSGACCSFARQKADGNDWNVLSSNLSFAHGSLLSLRGANSNIENNQLTDAGTLAIHNPGNGSLVKNNTILRANTQLSCYKAGACSVYDTQSASRAIFPGDNFGAVEAGGMKIAGGIGNVTVDGNEIGHINGRGLWSDVKSHDLTFSNNRIHHTWRSGIFYEISDGGVINGNVIWETGWKTPESNGGACISNNNSSDVEIFNNTCAWNADGIWIQSTVRDGAAMDAITGVQVHHNRILHSDTPTLGDSNKLAIAFLQGWSSQIDDASANNQSHDNKVYVPTPENTAFNRFGCVTAIFKTISIWNASNCATNDSYMSEAEKNAVVSTYGVPASQEPH